MHSGAGVGLPRARALCPTLGLQAGQPAPGRACCGASGFLPLFHTGRRGVVFVLVAEILTRGRGGTRLGLSWRSWLDGPSGGGPSFGPGNLLRGLLPTPSPKGGSICPACPQASLPRSCRPRDRMTRVVGEKVGHRADAQSRAPGSSSGSWRGWGGLRGGGGLAHLGSVVLCLLTICESVCSLSRLYKERLLTERGQEHDR